MSRRQMHLAAFMRPISIHTAAWRYPGGTPDANFNFPFIARMTQKLEYGKFDAFVMADHLAVLNIPIEALKHSATVTSFDPLTLLPALAFLTERIGLVATASTTFNQPYHVARKCASLDQISNGRAGRKGEFLSVRGPLNVARPVQGRPVVGQAGGSDPGRQLAAETAEAVFCAHPNLAAGQRFDADVKGRMEKLGRYPDHLTILPAALVDVGDTVGEARACGSDGFTIQFPFLPAGLADFVDRVVPELQRRGIFRRKYEGKTLRENMGLPGPENRFFARRKEVAEAHT